MGSMYAFDLGALIARFGRGIVSTYAPHQLIYTQDDSAGCVFYLHSGQINLTVVSEDGREAIIGTREAGGLFGEDCLSGYSKRISTAVAFTAATVARLDKSIVLDAIHSDIVFADYMVSHLSEESLRMKQTLIDHLFNSSEKRLARTLALLSNVGKPGQHDVILPKIDQQTLAKMVGTTRGRVNHFMNKFRRMGLIDYNGNITVHSSLLDLLLHDSFHNEEKNSVHDEPTDKPLDP